MILRGYCTNSTVASPTPPSQDYDLNPALFYYCTPVSNHHTLQAEVIRAAGENVNVQTTDSIIMAKFQKCEGSTKYSNNKTTVLCCVKYRIFRLFLRNRFDTCRSTVRLLPHVQGVKHFQVANSYQVDFTGKFHFSAQVTRTVLPSRKAET